MLNSDNKKCERCQIEDAIVLCESCEPFHYFCHRCDSIVHSMRVKSSHIRKNFINKPLNYQNVDQDNYTTAKFGDLNLPNSSKRYFRTLTPKAQRIILDNNKLSEKDNMSMNNEYVIKNNEIPHSKDYLNEIKRIHNKEKELLQYKINTLENNIERLKSNFQNEMKLMEERMNNLLREKKIMEEKYNETLDMTIKEKDEKIELLISENNMMKEKIGILEDNLKERENLMNKNINEFNNKIENLKNELANARKDNSILHKNHLNKVSEMVKNNNDNIKNLNELHKKEMDEIYYDGKFKNEKLIQQVENDLNKIEFLKNENEKMRENVKNLEEKNKNLIYKNQNMKEKIEEYKKTLEINRDLNDNLKKTNDKLKIENSNIKNDFDYYENTINGLKRELFLINDNYLKKEKDFNYLLEQSEKIRKDFSENMFNNEELEYNNRALKKENEELKKTINLFNEQHRCCHTYNY